MDFIFNQNNFDISLGNSLTSALMKLVKALA